MYSYAFEQGSSFTFPPPPGENCLNILGGKYDFQVWRVPTGITFYIKYRIG